MEMDEDFKPKKSRYQKVANYCANSSQIERSLIGIVIIAVLCIVILLCSVLHHRLLIIRACTNSACITESASLMSLLDTQIDPCEDFYKFTCSKTNRPSGSEQYNNKLAAAKKLLENEIYELYMEDVQNEDDYFAILLKSVFKKCMNETQIEKDGVKDIKEIMKVLGGWPALEGTNWKGDFDWMKASYRLRELGYYFSVFLDLKLVRNPTNQTARIFQVTIPDLGLANKDYLHNIDFLERTAAIFGANKPSVSNDIEDVYGFAEKLVEIYDNAFLRTVPSSQVTIADFQKKHGSIDWLEFIAQIGGPTVKVSPNDRVLFMDAEKMKHWFDLISTTSKRTLANYIMWTLILETSPYMTKELSNLSQESEDKKTRTEYCLDILNQRSNIVNPIYIKHARQHLTETKRQQVTEIAANIKSEMIASVKKVKWMENGDKEKAIKKTEHMRFVVGLPKKYLKMTEVNKVAVPSNSSFLNLISVLNRHYHDQLYEQIKYSVSQDRFFSDYISFETRYLANENILYVPIGVTKAPIFEKHQPNYINYANIGAFVGSNIANILENLNNTQKFWTDKTTNAVDVQKQCMLEQADQFKRHYFLSDFAFLLGSELKLSHAAYHRWVKTNVRELGLIGIDYSPSQLFWIFSMVMYCESISEPIDDVHSDIYSKVFLAAVRNIPEFATDFGCSSNAYMNPSKRCSLF